MLPTPKHTQATANDKSTTKLMLPTPGQLTRTHRHLEDSSQHTRSRTTSSGLAGRSQRVWPVPMASLAGKRKSDSASANNAGAALAEASAGRISRAACEHTEAELEERDTKESCAQTPCLQHGKRLQKRDRSPQHEQHTLQTYRRQS